ncbi:MAG: threonine/serine exporter family protein [Marinilabiliales bacterium]|nr:threonine/serine exporter family protein [Marinilabiliales bacterium]
MDYLALMEKGFWAGFAALGFAILFNVPQRTLMIIWLMGAIGGLVKFFLLGWEVNIALASLAGASAIGIMSVYAAHNKQSPPLVFSIPSVIPMVPGAFAYRMMLGFMTLASTPTNTPAYMNTMAETAGNGLKAMFILVALSGGVAIPMLITRKDTFKRIKPHIDQE